MSNSHPMSTQLQQVLSSPTSSSIDATAYYSNPFWAPGVRLMGSLPFRLKVMLISLVFMLPIFVFTFIFVSDYREKQAFNLGERQGIAVLRGFAPLTIDLLVVRAASRAMMGGFDASSSYKERRLAADERFKKLEAEITRTGDPLKVMDRFQSLRKSWETTASSSNGVDASGNNIFTPVALASLHLLEEVTDKSGLMLDPDADALYLALASVQSLPALIENLGQLRAFGAFVLSKESSFTAQERTKFQFEYAAFDTEVRLGFKHVNEFVGKAVAANPELKQKVNLAFMQEVEDFRAKSYQAVLAGDASKVQALWAEGKRAVDDLAKAYEVVLPIMDELIQARENNFFSSRMKLALLTLTALLLAAYFFYTFYLGMNGGLNLIRGHLVEMSEGDLRRAPNPPLGSDEAAAVILDLRKTYNSLHELIRKVRHSARELNSAAGEIASASADLGARTEAAAASLEEQASSMEEIGSTVTGTAERANMAATFAQDNAHVAENGGKVFQEVVTTMHEIHSSSSKIHDIISVIDGIAFQTNILALNAAVEAARAGESGRGFAVVASEVRSLAGRSAEAAREIKTLISASVEKVEGGTKVVEQAGQSMGEVVTNARQINMFLGEISTACREQANGVSEVGLAISELDRNTQQNAALVEQTTAAAASLRQQADILQEEIANFRVV